MTTSWAAQCAIPWVICELSLVANILHYFLLCYATTYNDSMQCTWCVKHCMYVYTMHCQPAKEEVKYKVASHIKAHRLELRMHS